MQPAKRRESADCQHNPNLTTVLPQSSTGRWKLSRNKWMGSTRWSYWSNMSVTSFGQWCRLGDPSPLFILCYHLLELLLKGEQSSGLDDIDSWHFFLLVGLFMVIDMWICIIGQHDRWSIYIVVLFFFFYRWLAKKLCVLLKGAFLLLRGASRFE